MPTEQRTIHLINRETLTATACGLSIDDLPREDMTSFPNKATCIECKKADLTQMYKNFEENEQRRGMRG